MKTLFYPKLAVMNIKKNGKFYFPYLLTCIGTVMMFYMICSISMDPGLSQRSGGSSLVTIMMFGTIVIGICSYIFLFYTNNFLMKRRKKEIGLYNILGMGKRHLAKIMFFETSVISLISLAFGIGFGILFNQLVSLLLYKLIDIDTNFTFTVSPAVILITIAVFGVLFLLILLSNVLRISVSKPIELLRGSNVGEREPKAKIILTILGILTLGLGYGIAIVTENPLTAIGLFFIAVILVIIGTYCLFISGSISVLKLLKKNTGFYYKTKHFTSVSGMLYRMKQNAVGLGNICILSTMVLVMISTTVCLYIGKEESIQSLYPNDLLINQNIKDYVTYDQPDEFYKQVITYFEKKNAPVTSFHRQLQFTFTGDIKDGVYKEAARNENISAVDFFYVLVQSDYSDYFTGDHELSRNEIAVYSENAKMPEKLKFQDMEFTVSEFLEENPEGNNVMSGYLEGENYIVVANDEVFYDFYQLMNEKFPDSVRSAFVSAGINMDAADKEQLQYKDDFFEDFKNFSGSVTSKADMRMEFLMLHGGLLFLGIFLGTMFLCATVLIIYYKQISEGYEDKERFAIMQKVGMSKEEVKHTIHSQVLCVFFLPLLAAAVHMLFAFKMITRLLLVFNLTNVALFAICTIGCIASFGLIYLVVYQLTAKSYYKIVYAGER